MSQKRYLQIANFDEQLHYKDKNPIWIKLHCSILDNYEFARISDETKFHAVGLMVLAARLNNKLPEDEAWLRQKINANSEINLKLLLEIGFLEAIKGARTGANNSFNARKSKKTKRDVSRAVSESSLAQNRTEQNTTEQNKTEEKKTEHNTTEQTREGLAPGAENGVVVCVDFKSSETKEENRSGSIKNAGSGDGHRSMFSLADCLRYAERSENVKNPHGLANTLYKTGSADAFIRAMLYPEEEREAERERYGAPVQFTAEPCRACFGVKMSDPDGRGFRACEHCKNERGKSTGFEPAEGNEQ